MKKQNSRWRAGYTLMEMMIILVIVGVLASMAVPGFMTMMPRMRLKSDARNNINYLRRARAKSVAENSQYGIYFDSGDRKFILFKDTYEPENTAYDDGQDSIIETSNVMYSGVNYGTSTFAGNCVVFFPSGSASTTGSINILNSTVGKTYTVSVLASTGKVSLQ
jgi:prepilin-type N-terminal cleavage/methylation domain-containing protein